MSVHEKELLELEERRRAAVAANDEAALNALFAEDYVHCHASAVVHNKSEMIRNVLQNPRTVDPRTPKVVVYGDTGILVGEMINRTRKNGTEGVVPTRLYATQVACKLDGEWKFVAFQATRMPG